ncbi:MarR family winged helix-turn-helix transcriptional regulator [Methylovirgula sp. 4M-Z18]|uniref:MarR family winged helix-turn-helix transcriptional regulator n=1 Tax=Methylovirgula sp. 4M-Z18 TaxID=2293567 RepID=UPI000E2FD657|nr:MarR family transcriptional regulator [Methylovirgula sp. 4M-Z18]RFB78211.1 MarR family transcriptional regulator [Methylovirgula sp. 4M-Z18]
MTDTAISPEHRDAAVDELLRSMGQLIRRLRAEANATELNLSQMSALGRLSQHGPLTTAELARYEAMKPQSMGAIVTSLEDEGLVQRQPHPTDGRQMLLSVTEAGEAMRQTSRLRKREWLNAALSRLDPEDQRVVIAAASVLKRLSEA